MIYLPARFGHLRTPGDDTAMLQAICALAEANGQPGDILDLSGSWQVSDTIRIAGTKLQVRGGFFTPTQAVGDVIEIDLSGGHVVGTLGIQAGGTTYADRLATNGVVLTRATSSTLDRVDVRGVHRSAVVSGADSQIDAVIGQIVAVDCGSVGGAVVDSHPSVCTIAYTDREDTGGDTSVSQRTTVAVAAGHPLVAGDLVLVAGLPYSVDSVAETWVSLYPKVLQGVGDGTGMLVSGHGAALDSRLEDTAGMTVSGRVYATRCGAGVAMSGLYGPSIQGMTAQFCTTAIQVGRLRGSAMRGGWLGNGHLEGCAYDAVRVTSGVVCVTVSNLNVPFDSDKWVKLTNTTGAGGSGSPEAWDADGSDGLTVVEGV